MSTAGATLSRLTKDFRLSVGTIPKLVLQKWILGRPRPKGERRGGEGVEETARVSHVMCDLNEVCRTYLRPTS